ncbi:MAG: hypothetical protein Q8L57_01565, partial [bacterium]|nr:hypothetical protein [bacterium]
MNFKKQISFKVGAGIIISAVILTAVFIYLWPQLGFPQISFPKISPLPTEISKPEIEGIEKFVSAEDFKNYLKEAQSEAYGGYAFFGKVTRFLEAPSVVPAPLSSEGAEMGG